MNFTQTEETLIRNFLVAKAAATLPSEIITRTRKLFASSQDFAARTSQTYVAAFKAHYLMISFAGFRDDPTKGCDDDPVTYVTYALQLYRDSQEEKDNKPNSHDLLVTDAIALRNAFLEDRVIVANKIEHQALVQIGEMIKVQPCEHIVGTAGDWLNFRLTVEVNS
jgi:hypothetical protein